MDWNMDEVRNIQPAGGGIEERAHGLIDKFPQDASSNVGRNARLSGSKQPTHEVLRAPESGLKLSPTLCHLASGSKYM